MNTETKIHEHDMEKYDTYRNAYNAGKSDALKEFVSQVTDRLNKHNDLIGVNGIVHEKAVIKVLNEYMKEALGDEG